MKIVRSTQLSILDRLLIFLRIKEKPQPIERDFLTTSQISKAFIKAQEKFETEHPELFL